MLLLRHQHSVKKCTPRGPRNNRQTCWDAKYENLYQTFLQYPEEHESSRAATAWSETVQNIDFSHSIPVAWSTLNNLTGRSRQFPCQCPVLANAIAIELVKTRNMGVQIEKFLDPLCKNCLTFRGLLLQIQ